jgi:muramidase (phage lysozyme)
VRAFALSAGAVAGLLVAASAGARAEAQAQPEPGPAPEPTNWNPLQFIDQPTQSAPSTDSNVRAFLEAIAWAEGTAKQPDPYRVCYGYKHTVQSFKRHPAQRDSSKRREWGGEPLTDRQCAGVGLGPGCVSTAAGKYQIILPTWVQAENALGLPDFGPESQDRAAEYLIQRRGALELVRQGRFTEAVQRCKKEWASLPGAGYDGQAMRREADLVLAYQNAGGILA